MCVILRVSQSQLILLAPDFNYDCQPFISSIPKKFTKNICSKISKHIFVYNSNYLTNLFKSTLYFMGLDK